MLKTRDYVRINVSLIILGFAICLISSCSIFFTNPATNLVNEQATSIQSQPNTFMMVAQPKLGVVLDEEMVVVDVDMGGPADRIGVQRGDRLLSLNEIPFLDNIDSVKDAIRATRHDEEQKSMRLIVERDGKEIAVEVEPNSHYIQKTPFESPLPTMTPLFLDKSRGAYYL